MDRQSVPWGSFFVITVLALFGVSSVPRGGGRSPGSGAAVATGEDTSAADAAKQRRDASGGTPAADASKRSPPDGPVAAVVEVIRGAWSPAPSASACAMDAKLAIQTPLETSAEDASTGLPPSAPGEPPIGGGSPERPLDAAASPRASFEMRASCPPPRRESSFRAATSTDVVEVTSLIAIVPDPSVTSMELRFDRTIEALLAGFKPYQLVLAGQWLPWNVDGAGNVRRQDQAQAGEGLAQEPGVLVLRKAKRAESSDRRAGTLARRPPAAPYDYAVVFLVPETAVYGVDSFLLRKALRLTAGIDPAPGKYGIRFVGLRPDGRSRPRVIILGPAYSASLEPLATALTNLSLFAGAPTRFTPDIQVVSTTATASTPEAWKDAPQRFLRVTPTFRDQTEALRGFLRTTLAPWNQEEDFPAALIQETDTVYGSAQLLQRRDGDRRWPATTFQFPRDLSVLRQASDASRGNLDNLSADARFSLSQGVGFDMRERHLVSQGVPVISSHAAESYAGLLGGLGKSIRQHRLRAFVLAGTNEMDLLFAARVIRSDAPDARPITFNADAIWTRWSNIATLGGTLTINTHPLVDAPAEQEQDTGTPWPRYLASSGAYTVYEGVEYAMALMTADNPPTAIAYHTPWGSWTGQDTPLWLSVLSRGSYWPVALLNETRAFADVAMTPRTHVDAKKELGRPARVITPLPMAFWFLAMLVSAFALLLGVTGSVRHSWFRRHNGDAWIGWLVGLLQPLNVNWLLPTTASDADAEIDAVSVPAYRALACYQALGCLALAGLLSCIAPLVLSSTLRARNGHVDLGSREELLWVLCVTALALTLMAAGRATWIALHGLRKGEGETRSNEFVTSERRAIGFLCFTAWLCFGVLAFGWRAILAHPAGAWRHDFLVLRSIHVESGVSPVLVIGVLCIPIYGWAWANGRRILLVACRRAELPWKNDGFTHALRPASATTLGDATREDLRVRRLASCVAHPLLEWRDTWIVIGGMLALTVGGSLAIPLTSLEGWGFDYLIVAMFALIAVFGIGASLRAWRTWQFLRSWLIRLESHPVRGAFNRLDPDVRGAPLWGSGKSRATLVTERRALELLVRIHELGSRRAALGAERRAAVATAFEALENLAAAEDSTIADERRAWFRAEAPRARRTYEAILGRETQALIDDVLSEPWCTGRVPAPTAAGDGTSSAPPDPTSGAVAAQLVDLAEQLVATRWLRFVRYYLGHVRLQIEYAVAAFVAIVVALSVYAFAGVGTIRVAIVVLSATFAAFLATVLAQVDRDPLMSRITGTDANKLTADFLVRMATYGLLPAITVLMSFFPSLARAFAYFGQPFPR